MVKDRGSPRLSCKLGCIGCLEAVFFTCMLGFLFYGMRAGLDSVLANRCLVGAELGARCWSGSMQLGLL